MASVDTSLVKNRKRRNAATKANERLASLLSLSKKSRGDDSAGPSHNLQPTLEPSNSSVNSVALHCQIVPRAQNQEAIVENVKKKQMCLELQKILRFGGNKLFDVIMHEMERNKEN